MGCECRRRRNEEKDEITTTTNRAAIEGRVRSGVEDPTSLRSSRRRLLPREKKEEIEIELTLSYSQNITWFSSSIGYLSNKYLVVLKLTGHLFLILVVSKKDR